MKYVFVVTQSPDTEYIKIYSSLAQAREDTLSQARGESVEQLNDDDGVVIQIGHRTFFIEKVIVLGAT